MSSAILISIMFLVAGSVICCWGEEVNTTFGCIATERNALIKFKTSFLNPYDRLSSWNILTNTDCCEWQGVKCDTITGHVIGLDLRNEMWYGSVNMLVSKKLDSSIIELKHLSFLDLSGNDFQYGSIPEFLGSMNQLQHLNLSYANFSGVVPHHIGNLSRLTVLDLSYNGLDYLSNYYTHPSLIVDDFMWASRLSLLTHLDMGFVNLTRTKDLLKVLNFLPYIVDLRLAHNRLKNRNLQHACVNSTTLHNIQVLDLSFNSFDGELPCFLQNMTSLRALDLSNNSYDSCSRFDLTRLTNLVSLSLSYNSFQCNVDRISEFLLPNKCHLVELNLESNSFYGDVSKIFLFNSSRCWNQKLAILELSDNQFYGQLPEQVSGFKKLEYLSLSHNNISGPIATSITNMTALTLLSLGGNKFNGQLPEEFGDFKKLEYLFLSDNLISGPIPTSMTNLTALANLDLSFNKFYGQLPEEVGRFNKLYYLDLSGNLISGPIPTSITNLTALAELNLAINKFNSSIPSSFEKLTSLLFLRLFDNQLSGKIPSSFGNLTSLSTLNLSNNKLSGNLPVYWATKLSIIILSSNQLSGVIPNLIIEPYWLIWLQFSNNNFTGEIPSTLRNSTNLIGLDIGYNAISGKLPKWIGNDLTNLQVLRLTNIDLYGKIPLELCRLFKLQILDLANNKLTGNIPRCFGNFSEMVTHDSSSRSVLYDPSSVLFDSSSKSALFGGFSLQQVMKGNGLEYVQNLKYLVNMDLSNNDLVGEIPLDLTRLAALRGLNLSHNHLQGMIPGRIGDMKSLESLDLSNNNLFGNIPESLSELTFLSYLNLSHNNLGGEIPPGHQLQTFEPSSFQGNPGLCGDPLPKKCHDNKAASTPNAMPTQTEEEEEDSVDKIWFYGVVISGFATGIWGAIGGLVFKRGWRFVYFKFVDDVIARVFGR